MFDVIIAGGGSAGCVLANRLTEDPATRVLLLEAGPRDRKLEIAIPAAFAKLFGSKVDWAFQTEPEPGTNGRRVFFPRGRTLGGSSSTNALMWVPGHRADFEAWDALGWGHDAVLPWLRRAAEVMAPEPLRDRNPITAGFLDAAHECGWRSLPDLSDLELEGAGPTCGTTRNGRRHSAANAYLRPARRRRNLTVWTQARALRVVVAEGRAVGVEVERAGRRGLVAAAREVVVCGGAIGSPQLLMLSGIGPADHLRAHGLDVVADLPVGRNLRDHPITPVCARTRAPVSLKAAESPANLARWLVRRRGMLASLVAQAAAFVRTRPGLAAPDIELLFAPVLFVDEGRTPPPEHGFTIGPVVLKPRSRGSVSLRSSDPLDAPAIAPGYLSDPGDLDTMFAGIQLARQLLRTRGLAPWMDGELSPGDVDDLDAWARGAVQGLYHPVGTCAIGAVVDPELRVRGIEALRVVDASVLPDVVRGHTNAITLAVAERAAAVIRGQARVAWSGWADSSHPMSSSSPAAASSARHG
jgi:choline dehydrogenase